MMKTTRIGGWTSSDAVADLVSIRRPRRPDPAAAAALLTFLAGIHLNRALPRGNGSAGTRM